MYQAVRLPRESIIVISIYDLDHLQEVERQEQIQEQLWSLSSHLTQTVFSIVDVSDSNGSYENIRIALDIIHNLGHIPMVAGVVDSAYVDEDTYLFDEVDLAIDEARSFLAESGTLRSA